VVVEGAPRRFVALDSWRGIAALMVAAYHIHGPGAVLDSRLLRSGLLWVDFFFVLSGFVIAAAYSERLAQGFSLRRFAILRLGRVWPLHLAVIALALVLELALWSTNADIYGRTAFTADKDLVSLASAAFLVQIWQDRWVNGWNQPGWSISAEICAYLAAALIWRFVPRKANLAFATLFAMAVVAWWLDWWTRHQIWALVRVFLGFPMGVLAWEIHRRFIVKRISLGGLTAAECASALGLLAGITFSDSVPQPIEGLLFGFVVLVYARDGGLISRLLAGKLPVMLGTISYAIYMVHVPVIRRICDLAELVQGSWAIPGIRFDRSTMEMTGSPLIVDLAAGILLVVVVAVAWLCWRNIEQPAREWSRRLAS
jgi:peptidoglycan/LPS O-acetylase OafA/YrhL